MVASSTGTAQTTELTCVVADNERLVAQSLSDSLVRYRFKTLAVAYTAGDAISQTLEHKPDVLIVDLDFGPGPTGVDVAVLVRKQQSRVGIVIVTGYEDPRLLAPGLPDLPPGALYLVKHHLENPKQVAEAARQAHRLATSFGTKVVPHHNVDLTDSQVELLRLVAMGLSNTAISEALVVTPAAVEKAVTRLATKLGIDRSHDANLRVALTHRYLEFVGSSRVAQS
jgi:DNA-binding NarL/FixJ family response regulator